TPRLRGQVLVRGYLAVQVRGLLRERLVAGLELALLLVEDVELAVQARLTFFEPTLDALELLAAPRLLPLPLLLRTERRFLARQLGGPPDVLGFLLRLGTDPRGNALGIRLCSTESNALDSPTEDEGTEGDRAHQDYGVHDHSKKGA